MPVIPEYKRQVTETKPLKIPSNNIKLPAEAFGANAMASVGAAAYKTATEVITREEEALADAAIASAATQYRASLESMKSVRGTQALNPEFENTQMEAMLGGMRAIRDKLPTIGAQNRFNEWVTRTALPDQFRFGIQSHVRAQTQQIEKQAFDAQINLHESELVATDDPMQALTKLEEISRATIQYGRKNGQADIDIKNALAAKALTIANQKLMSAYNRSSADQLQGMAYAFRPFLSEDGAGVLQRIVDDKRKEDGQAAMSAQAMQYLVNGARQQQATLEAQNVQYTGGATGIGKTTINTGIREESASDGGPVIRLWNGNSISFKDITVTPESFSNTIMAMSRATRDNGFVLPTGAGNMKHVLPHLAYIDSLEKKYNLPRGLLLALALVESGWNPNAVGPETKYGRAAGIAQFIPSTAKDYGLTDRTNVRESFRAMAEYIATLNSKYSNGDSILSVGLYNWGHAGDRPKKIRAGVMPDETRNHMRKVQVVIAATSRLMDSVLGAQGANAQATPNTMPQPAQGGQSAQNIPQNGVVVLAPGLSERAQQNAVSTQAGHAFDPNHVSPRQRREAAALAAGVTLDANGMPLGTKQQIDDFNRVDNELKKQIDTYKEDIAVKDQIITEQFMERLAQTGRPDEMLLRQASPSRREALVAFSEKTAQEAINKQWIANGYFYAEDDGATAYHLMQKPLAEKQKIIPADKWVAVHKKGAEYERQMAFAQQGILDDNIKQIARNVILENGIDIKQNTKEESQFMRAFGQAIAQRPKNAPVDYAAIAIGLIQRIQPNGRFFVGTTMYRYEAAINPAEREYDEKTGLIIPFGKDKNLVVQYIRANGLIPTDNLVRALYTIDLASSGVTLFEHTKRLVGRIINNKVTIPGVDNKQIKALMDKQSFILNGKFGVNFDDQVKNSPYSSEEGPYTQGALNFSEAFAGGFAGGSK